MRWFVLAAFLASGSVAHAASYDGHAVVRVDASDVDQLIEAGAERWGHGSVDGSALLRVPPSARAAVAASGLVLKTMVQDLQVRADEERARLSVVGPTPHGAAFFSDFRDLAAIEGRLDGLAADRPDITELVDLGLSFEGRSIRGIRIGSGDTSVLVTGTVHAREWLATMSTICIADRLVRGEGDDPEITEALAGAQVIVVPVANPDGYQYSWDSERYWRKNRRDGHGVDINRNFPVGWGGPGSSGDMDQPDYRGTEALSEPESVAIADFVTGDPSLVAHIDLHTFGELVLYPWSHMGMEPADVDELASLAGAIASSMEAENGEAYLELRGFELYPAAGVISDWSYGDAGLMAFTTELRPSFDEGDFVVDPALIEPTCDETLAGVMELVTWALGPVDPPGTTTGDPTTSGGSSGGGDTTSTGAGETSPPPPGTTSPPPATDDGPPPPPPAEGTTTGDTGGAASRDTAGCGCGSGSAGGFLWLLLVPWLRKTRR